MLQDTLATALSAINNAELRGKTEVVLTPSSRLLKEVLTLLKKEEYIQNFEFVETGRGGQIKVTLNGAINKINAIKPRYAITLQEFEKFEKRYLPAKDFGRIIISTSKGVTTHIDAKTKKLGGVLLAYVY
jgi:small subunit ribosomal protein S8